MPVPVPDPRSRRGVILLSVLLVLAGFAAVLLLVLGLDRHQGTVTIDATPADALVSDAVVVIPAPDAAGT
ncbi:MAG: hypothetical protein K8M05_05210, partial [Deltaproteobacteria bacterium]|nr:hypothetical protein [Kofleriaceae bacterium]